MTRSSSTLQLSAEVRKMAQLQLLKDWRGINATYFHGELRPPVLTLCTAASFLGRWNPNERTIEINETVLVSRPWKSVYEILKHEVAHQVVSELYSVSEAPHGPMFRKVCEHMGIPAHASERGGDIQADLEQETQDPEQMKLMDRVRKLLALAESPNRNEAEVAAAAAQRLIYKYNIELQDERVARGFAVIHLGDPTGRVQEHERVLCNILSDHFFVETIWVHSYRPHDGKSGSVIEASGLPANIAMAQYVYHFILDTSHRLWEQHKRETGLASNRPRLSFLAGVMNGFGSRLQLQSQTLHAEGLVLVPNAKLHEFFRQRHPYVRSISSHGQPRNDAFAAGSAAGRQIILQKPVSQGSTGGARKALPSGRG